MNWRQYLKQRMDTIAVANGFTVFAAGALTGSPPSDQRPFIVINVGSDYPELNDGDAPAWSKRTASIWVHDDPGSYDRIDDIIPAIRAALVGQVAQPDAIAITWDGDSDQLADDMMGTIVRNTNYQLIGRP